MPSTSSFTATFTEFADFTNQALPATIPQFDTMGGIRTLQSVEIISSVEVDTTVCGTLTNRPSAAATYEATVTNASISVTGTGFTNPLSATCSKLLDTGPINCPARSTATIGPFAASLSNCSDFTLTSPADLAAFMGSGNLSYTASAAAHFSVSITGGSNILNNTMVTTTGNATIEVIYTFVTNPTLATTVTER